MEENERVNVLKFYYEMLQDEIDENSNRGNLYKTIIIPVALGGLGLAIQQGDVITTLVITIVGSIALMLVLLIDMIFTIANNRFINRQKEIEELIKLELRTDYLKGLRCPDDDFGRCESEKHKYKFPLTKLVCKWGGNGGDGGLIMFSRFLYLFYIWTYNFIFSD